MVYASGLGALDLCGSGGTPRHGRIVVNGSERRSAAVAMAARVIVPFGSYQGSALKGTSFTIASWSGRNPSNPK